MEPKKYYTNKNNNYFIVSKFREGERDKKNVCLFFHPPNPNFFLIYLKEGVHLSTQS